jgi:hypothetical protein
MLGPLLHKPITKIEDTENKKLLSTPWRCFVVIKAAPSPSKIGYLFFLCDSLVAPQGVESATSSR